MPNSSANTANSCPKTTELKEFIKYSVSMGIPREQIKNMLIESGWPKDIVFKVFESRHPEAGRLTAGNAAVRVACVKKSFGKNIVLDGINIAVMPGEIFGIIGLSGSGKTTLLNTIVGFVTPDEGDVVVKLHDKDEEYIVSAQANRMKCIFGFAAQRPSFYGKLTVEENIDYFASLYGFSRKERKLRREYLIRMVGLEHSKNVLAQDLSGGMQKRLDMACAIVHDPKILLLDEPTSDLDSVTREEVWKLIKEINSKGTTIILASHFVNELEELCTRFAILHNSKIAEIGTPDELRDAYSKNYEIVIVTKSMKYDTIISELKAMKHLNIDHTAAKGRCLSIYTQSPEDAIHAIVSIIRKSGQKIVDMKVNKPTINELFESVVKRS